MLYTGIDWVRDFESAAAEAALNKKAQQDKAAALAAEEKRRKWEKLKAEAVEFGIAAPRAIRSFPEGLTPARLQGFRAKVFLYVEARLGLEHGGIPEHAKAKINGSPESLELVEGLLDADTETAQDAWGLFVSQAPLFFIKEVRR